jgi:hypothetical protein
MEQNRMYELNTSINMYQADYFCSNLARGLWNV